jgi:hypothetical protein
LSDAELNKTFATNKAKQQENDNPNLVIVEPQCMPRVRNLFAVVFDSSEACIGQMQEGALLLLNEEASDLRRLQRLIFEEGR